MLITLCTDTLALSTITGQVSLQMGNVGQLIRLHLCDFVHDNNNNT